MTEKSLAFVRFLNLRAAISSNDNDHGTFHHDTDLLLSYIYEHNAAEKPLIMTHLFHQKTFGASPTIQRRIKELVDAGLIETYGGEDKRQRCLKLTEAGIAYLQKCSDLMQAALSGS